MRRYSVHHPSKSRAIVLAEADRLEFVKEGFCWPCLFVPLLWLIYRRQWLALGGYLVVIVSSSTVLTLVGVNEAVSMFAGLAINLLLAIHGNDLRRWSLSRRGYALLTVVFASGLDQAERSFFHRLIDGDLDQPAAIIPATVKPVTDPDRSYGSEPVLGLFPAAGEPR